MSYTLDPHSHVKIWLSNNPDLFMNFENQTRLIAMREKNPKDKFHLIYDSTLLTDISVNELLKFCNENSIIPVDADLFQKKLHSEEQRELYKFYKDEITHLKNGGNLAVASDILRLLPPSYKLGIYTDLDVPIDTSNLPKTIQVESPLLLHIGSLQLLGNKEMMLAQNDYIAVANADAAKEQMKQLHEGVLSKLREYSTDYISETESILGKDNWFNSYLMSSMQNRAEYFYIQKSNELKPGAGKISSREFRAYVNEVMSNKTSYLNFHRQINEKTGKKETDTQVILRLRAEIKSQLSLIKWTFFHKEYRELRQLLSKNNEHFIKAMMKKERSLYYKSIVVCTTGPVEVTRSFFGKYILTSKEIDEIAEPISYSTYKLHKAFISRNGIPLHQNILAMLNYLGADVGELNDSSWLEEGQALQKSRSEKLIERKLELTHDMPILLQEIEDKLLDQLITLKRESTQFFGIFASKRKTEKIKAIELVLDCFSEETQTFDILAFKKVLSNKKLDMKQVFAGGISHRTKRLLKGLEQLCDDAVMLRISKDKKLSFAQQSDDFDLEGSNVSIPSEIQNLTPGRTFSPKPTKLANHDNYINNDVTVNPAKIMTTLFAHKSKQPDVELAELNQVTTVRSPSAGG